MIRLEDEMRLVNRIGWIVAIVSMVCAAAATPGAQAPPQTASQFYMSYRAAFEKAATIEEVFPYVSKDIRAKMESTPAAERPKMFEFVKQMSNMTDVKVVKETKTDDGATLTVEAVSSDKEKMTGQIQVVKEGGAWKMGKESWSNKS
jgi:Domain of unknown function (DUF4878)